MWSPAYAGMILAEQGHAVVKWTNGKDPILSLNRGDELWAWINHGKRIEDRHPEIAGRRLGSRSSGPTRRTSSSTTSGRPPSSAGASIPARSPDGGLYGGSRCDPRSAIVPSMSSPRPAPGSNTPPGCRSGRGTPSAACGWPSRRWPTGRRGISRSARRRACRSLSRGSWSSSGRRPTAAIPWEVDPYRVEGGEAIVEYKGTTYREPIRDRSWKLDHLWHDQGRIPDPERGRRTGRWRAQRVAVRPARSGTMIPSRTAGASPAGILIGIAHK